MICERHGRQMFWARVKLSSPKLTALPNIADAARLTLVIIGGIHHEVIKALRRPSEILIVLSTV